MSRRHPSSGWAASTAILLIGAGLAGAWLLAGPSLLGAGGEPALHGPLAAVSLAKPTAAGAALLPGVKAVSSAQLSQPRDPFRPLITPDAVVAPPGASPGTGGTGGTPGIAVRLVSIEDVAGVLRATVEVNGTAYDVGVGEVFATDFMVVSLDADSGVFLFGDNAFELSIGQEILK